MIERNKMMAYNTPLLLFKQKVGRFLLMCIHGNFKGIIRRFFGDKNEK